MASKRVRPGSATCSFSSGYVPASNERQGRWCTAAGRLLQQVDILDAVLWSALAPATEFCHTE
jgi:hypothetical protein